MTWLVEVTATLEGEVPGQNQYLIMVPGASTAPVPDVKTPRLMHTELAAFPRS